MSAGNQPSLNRKAVHVLAATILLLVPLLSASSVNVRAAPTYTEVGGPIIADTTWTLANSPYIVVANVEVWQGVTLTIQPGVVVKFNKDELLQVGGTLIARGTVANSITFTSNQTSPTKGDWKHIKFIDSSVDATFDNGGNYTGGSILEYCIVEYGGNGVDGAVRTDHAAPLIDHCTVRNNNSSGIRAVGVSSALVVVRNNIVSGNSAGSGGGGIFATYSTVTANTVSGNSTGGFGSLGGGIYATYSPVTGNTVSGNSASYGGGISAYLNSPVTGNTVSGNSASYGGGIYAYLNSPVTGNTVSGNSAINGGGIYAYSPVTGNTVSGNSADSGGGIHAYGPVTGNTVSGNSARSGGGIYAYNSTVTGNTVSGNSASYGGGGIVAVSNTVVMSNTIIANSLSSDTGQGSGVNFTGSSDILYNTIVGNTAVSPTAVIGGVAINGTPQFHHNNLYGNSNYDMVVEFSQDISGTHNSWGTVATVDILAHVYDWYDDSARGKLLYIPYLQDPDPNAPVPPPRNLRANFAGGSASLSWDAIPSTTTGYGYKVYYDTDASGPPYHGAGAAEGNSPIDVGSATHFTLSGLGSGGIYAAITTYDTQGRESWYSNEAVGLRRTYLPMVLGSVR